MSSSSSPFTYKAVEVIFGSIYFHFDFQTAPNLQDFQYSDNLTTIPKISLILKQCSVVYVYLLLFTV